MTRLVWVVVAVFVAVAGSAQSSADAQGGDPGVVAGIAAGNAESIDAAGRSGDERYLPPLRAAWSNPRILEHIKQETLLPALVRLDDRDAGQRYWCMTIPDSSSPPIEGLKFTGGYYAIRALDAILLGAGQAGYLRGVKKLRPEDRDSVGYEPKHVALDVLPAVVPNAPPFSLRQPLQAFDVDAVASRWHQWIDEHRQELRMLKPVGDGVNYTDAACLSNAR